MHRFLLVAAVMILASSSPALAQRFSFEKTLESKTPAVLDVSTIRGKIDVTVGQAGRVGVAGAATVRVGFNVPVNAVDLARKVAANPPIEREGNTIRLRDPADEAVRRAVTVSYQVQVPPDTAVRAASDSGTITVSRVGGAVAVRTQSSAIDLDRVGGSADVTTGSGAVRIDGVGGALTVKTSSSGITLRGLQGDARIRTQSGAVDAAFAGRGDVDVETSSSAIALRNVRGGLTVMTQSGRVTAQGEPSAAWEVSTGSGAVEIATTSAAFRVDAMNQSGSIAVNGAPVKGTVSKRQIAGTVGAGGPLVRVVSRSGSITITTPTP
jgi:putative adhesin